MAHRQAQSQGEHVSSGYAAEGLLERVSGLPATGIASRQWGRPRRMPKRSAKGIYYIFYIHIYKCKLKSAKSKAQRDLSPTANALSNHVPMSRSPAAGCQSGCRHFTPATLSFGLTT